MTTATEAPIDRFVAALRAAGCDPREVGTNQWHARCPGHDDRTPSLRFTTGNNGSVLLKCHAGCDKATVLDPLGMVWQDLYAGMTPKRDIVATYDYTDAEGAPLFQVVRFQPKDFRQRRADGNGGWIWNLKGVPRVLYRLPNILATNPDVDVYVTEGEKDADRLTDLGLVATCNPMGAENWKHVDDSPLAGRRVIILPDNDDLGRQHAEDVKARLNGKAASVRVVELPFLPDKGDVSDWLDNGHDTEDLWRLAERESEPQETEREAKTPEPKASDAIAWTKLTGVEPEEIEWLWWHRFPLGKVSIIGGLPGLGKSFVTLDMAARVSRSGPWPDLPNRDNPAGNVLLFNLEDGLGDTIRPRLDHARADLERINAIEGVREQGKDEPRIFDVQRDAPLLEEHIEHIGDVRLVVIDPLTGYLPGVDAHRDNNVRSAIYPLVQMAKRHDLAVIVVMHLRKAEAAQAINRVSGSVAFTALARAVWLVGEHPDDPDVRLLLPTKMNVAKPAPGLRFRIVEPGRVEWLGDTDITADEAFAPVHEDGPKVKEAMSWLEKALANGAERATDIVKQAKQNGISTRTLERAKPRLRINSERVATGGKDVWFWSLPTEE